MPDTMNSSPASLIPPPPVPEGAQDFSQRVLGLMDGQEKDDATVSRALEGMEGLLEVIAAGLYSMASMLVGEGEDGVRVVETAVATAEVSACDDVVESRRSSHRALAKAALEILAKRDPEGLAAPAGVEPSISCIEDDDLEAAGVSKAELERMIAGPDRDRVRRWLEKLPADVRTVFVLRAVAGFPAGETAQMLAWYGGPKAAGWTGEEVRWVFRQGLCSLASQLIQESTRGAA
jgi:hypothetical protein